MKTVKEWPSNERIDAIGANGNDGLHYPPESECPLSPNFELAPIITLEGGKAYQFDVRSSGRIVQAIYNKFDDKLYVSKCQWFDVASADNIKPLTVEGE